MQLNLPDFNPDRPTTHFAILNPFPLILESSIQAAANEITRQAAIRIPDDYRSGIREVRHHETGPLSCFVLDTMIDNWDAAVADQRPMCADTGLPRYYVKFGNDVTIEGGFVALERALRRATAEATASIPLRPNRVHPLTREDHNNNVGARAPEIEYSVEPDADWLDITTVHKGGLFGTDYRMLFPGDGWDGIKKMFLDTMIQFGRRGLACQPAIVGIGIGGSKDTSMVLGKQAACLRVVGDRHPDPSIAKLEDELKELGNQIGMGPMGFVGSSMVVDCHIELRILIQGACRSASTVFVCLHGVQWHEFFPDGTTKYRTDPKWFTPYHRRETVE